MKTAIKLALVGAALLGGVAANAAQINGVNPLGLTGTNLVLLLKGTDNTFYVEELSATVADVKSVASVQSAGAGQYSLDGTGVAGTLTVPSLFASFNSLNLATYLTTHANATWTIVGGRNANGGQNETGDQSEVLTSKDNYLIGARNFSGSEVGNMVSGTEAMFIDSINAAAANGNPYVNNVNNTNGCGDTSPAGSSCFITFNGENTPNGATVGTAQYLYLLTTSSEGLSGNVYKSASTLQLNLNGTFSYTGADLGGGAAPVPVPAALWLLGSGLLGLVGVGRRSNKAAA